MVSPAWSPGDSTGKVHRDMTRMDVVEIARRGDYQALSRLESHRITPYGPIGWYPSFQSEAIDFLYLS